MAQAFHRRFLARSFFAFAVAERHTFSFFGRRDTFVARLGIFLHIIGADSGDFVMRIFQIRVRNQEHGHVQPLFHAEQFGAFFIQQERGHIHRHLRMHFARVVLHRRILNQAQNVQRGGFDAADNARAGTARAGNMAAFGQCRLQSLARQLQQPEARQFAHLHARAVFFQRIAQHIFHIALVLGIFHIDKVDDHQAAQVAQTHLPRHFFRRFHVRAERSFLNIRAACGTCGVHVDGNQGFRVVNHNRTAAGQAHRARKRRFDLLLDLQARKQWRVVGVEFEPRQIVRHHITHKFRDLLVNFGIIHQNFGNIGAVIIADGANDQRAFHKQQIRLFMRRRRFFNGTPKL